MRFYVLFFELFLNYGDGVYNLAIGIFSDHEIIHILKGDLLGESVRMLIGVIEMDIVHIGIKSAFIRCGGEVIDSDLDGKEEVVAEVPVIVELSVSGADAGSDDIGSLNVSVGMYASYGTVILNLCRVVAILKNDIALEA